MTDDLQAAVDAAWEQRDQINSTTAGPVRAAVEAALARSMPAGAGGRAGPTAAGGSSNG